MKRLFLILGLAMLVVSCGGEKTQTSSTTTEAPKRHGWDGYGFALYGDVAQVVETYWQAADKFGEVVKDKLDYREVWIFDERGNAVSRTNYDSNGKLANKGIYKYDNEGRCVDYSKYRSDGKLRLKTIFRYDDKGNCIEEAWYDADGRLSRKTVRKFNDNGKCIEVAEYDADGCLQEKSLYSYNSEGECVEMKCCNSDGKVERKATYIYNDKGQITEETGVPSHGGRYKSTRTYDANGRLVESVYESNYHDGDIGNFEKLVCCRYKQDSHDNMVEIRQYSYRGELIVPETISEYEITYR